MTTMTVMDAEAALAKARAEARQKRIDDAKVELKAVRSRAKQLRKELVANIAEVAESDNALARLRAELSGIDESIARRSAPSPDPLDDPEDREEALPALRAYRQEVGEKLRTEENRAPSRIRGIELKQQWEHLQFVAANLLNTIENGGQLGWQGGVGSVR
jgi:hypothetical protein